MCWLFPGHVVRIEAPCLDCGEPLALEMREGQILQRDPATIVGHLNHPWSIMATDRAYG